MRKHIEHFFWRTSDTVKNTLFVLGVIAVVLIMFGASAFSFWLKIQFANWLFG